MTPAPGGVLRFLPRRVVRWGARRNLAGLTPVIVYQMAKVGSSAIVEALRRARLPVFHIHRMNAGNVERMRETRRALGWNVPPVAANDRAGLRLRNEAIDRRRRVAIITMVRDPIARNLSSYFEFLDDIWGRPCAYQSVAPELLLEGFFARFPQEEALTWFDDEMLPVTGIDVYEHSFPDTGHLAIARESIDLFVIKNERSDEEKREALSAFLNMPLPPLERVNRTADKAKGAAFVRFLAAFRPERSYIETMLESRYVRHFYSAAERLALSEKYTRNQS
jgi:hypothetical protein